jgi:hypothetical protein
MARHSACLGMTSRRIPAHTKVTPRYADRGGTMYDAFLALSFAAMIFTPALVAFHVSRSAESHLE